MQTDLDIPPTLSRVTLDSEDTRSSIAKSFKPESCFSEASHCAVSFLKFSLDSNHEERKEKRSPPVKGFDRGTSLTEVEPFFLLPLML